LIHRGPSHSADQRGPHGWSRRRRVARERSSHHVINGAQSPRAGDRVRPKALTPHLRLRLSTAPVSCACRLRPSPAQAGPRKAGETSGPALGARGSPETSAALSRGWRRVHTKDLELPPPTSKPVDPSGWTVTRSQSLARKDQTLTSARNLAKAMFDALIQATPRPPRSTTQSWVAPDTPAMWKRISIGCATVAAQARGLSVSR